MRTGLLAKKDDICKGLKEKAASSIKLANEGLPIRPIGIS